MKIFRGNDEFLTPEHMMCALRAIAQRDAVIGEYHPSEHTCWAAADMIQKQQDIILAKAPEIWLRELADRLENYEFKPKYPQHDNEGNPIA